MKLIILGCGTSTGVPVIGCHCPVCSSGDERNRRTRSSALIRTAGMNILIDTSTDLRAQSLANGIERIDAVLFTHPHADHIHGIDELRAFNHAQGASIPCYGNAQTIGRIRHTFDYIFKDNAGDGWKPSLSTTIVEDAFTLFGKTVIPVHVRHGRTRILGYRIGGIAYITDCSSIPPESMKKLEGLDLLVLGALRQQPHPTHFSISQALEIVSALKPAKTLFTHLSHNLEYSRDNATLPEGVELARDGMAVDVGR